MGRAGEESEVRRDAQFGETHEVRVIPSEKERYSCFVLFATAFSPEGSRMAIRIHDAITRAALVPLTLRQKLGQPVFTGSHYSRGSTRCKF